MQVSDNWFKLPFASRVGYIAVVIGCDWKLLRGLLFLQKADELLKKETFCCCCGVAASMSCSRKFAVFTSRDRTFRIFFCLSLSRKIKPFCFTFFFKDDKTTHSWRFQTKKDLSKVLPWSPSCIFKKLQTKCNIPQQLQICSCAEELENIQPHQLLIAKQSNSCANIVSCSRGKNVLGNWAKKERCQSVAEDAGASSLRETLGRCSWHKR